MERKQIEELGLDRVSYKDAGNGWTTKIHYDDKGVEISRISFKDGIGCGTGLHQEMLLWLKIPGNEIEPVLTDAGKIAQSEAEKIKALETQKNTVLQLLNDSDKKVNGDWPYPEDGPAWIEVREKWRAILKSTEIVQIPEKPF